MARLTPAGPAAPHRSPREPGGSAAPHPSPDAPGGPDAPRRPPHAPEGSAAAHLRRAPGEPFGPGFALFADMLLAGLLTTVAALPVVTIPAALAAASASLRQAATGGAHVTFTGYARRLRARLAPRTLAAGLALPLLAGVLLVDVALIRAGLPGAGVAGPALALLALAAATAGLRATALPEPYGMSAREALRRLAGDPRGTLLLACAVLLAVLLGWSIPLLVPLLPGPLAFAATVVDLRRPGVSG